MGLKVEKVNVQNQLASRDFLTFADYNENEINYVLELASILKNQHKLGKVMQPLKGKVLGMIFSKSSTRTRVSFETGFFQLGGKALFLNENDIQLGRGESILDTAKVLSSYLDGIMIRTYSHEMVEELAEHASIPVINGLTDLYHPCQVLADLQTIQEVKGGITGIKIAYVGDGNNMAHSLMLGAAIMGMDICIASPKGYEPNHTITKKAIALARLNGCTVKVTSQPQIAVSQADVIYTDVWASMGQENEQVIRETVFADFQVNNELCSHAKKDYIFMHCLPAHRGEEVTSEVIDGKQSVVYQQAENRLHAQKALMVALMS